MILPLPTQEAPHTTVAIARQINNGQSNLFHQTSVVSASGRTSIPPVSRPRQLVRHIRARYTENLTDLLHWSSSGNECEHAIHFRDFATSTASRRISFSIVFFPSSR
ncbi:hypothetical protein AWB78_01441 [Caballeronia calidae]|uniref:Uncharacterized protein n=1 Tax=Caballeronia calidae TaxID=1777139 RepID=A0A158ABX2_9BURK|nr:hypothetical protein AWB78_01441 [Caballeronia calidae]